jgi:phage shock protein E
MSTIKSLVKEQGATVIDVRQSWEYSDGHVEGALNIPLDEIPNRVSDIKAMHQPVIVYCRSGSRSGMAAGILQQMGLETVINGGGLGEMQIQLM